MSYVKISGFALTNYKIAIQITSVGAKADLRGNIRRWERAERRDKVWMAPNQSSSMPV